MNNMLKKGLLFIMIILLFSAGLSSIVQGDVVFDDYKWDIVSDSSDSTTNIHILCGRIYNLTKLEFENSTLCWFYSSNMRELYYTKGSSGTWMIWYIHSLSDEEYLIECSNFRGILTQKFIFGYIIEYYEY